jgi:hypothetical protein
MSRDPSVRYLFLHAPKTAGTTMSGIMRRQFGDLFHQENPFYGQLAYEPWMLDHIFSVHPQTALQSHYLRSASVPLCSRYNYRAFTFVRDPVEIVPSGYFDARNRVAGPGHLSRQLGLADALRHMLAHECAITESIAQSQVSWQFCELSNQRSVEELFKEYASRIDYFPTERFDDAMICLEKLYPEELGDCSYEARMNRAERDQEVDRETLELIEQLPWMDRDRHLHSLAVAHIDELLARFFSQPGELDAYRDGFRRRCDQRCVSSPFPAAKAQPQRMSLKRRIRVAARVLVKGC